MLGLHSNVRHSIFGRGVQLGHWADAMASVPTAEQGVTINFEWLLGWTGGTQPLASALSQAPRLLPLVPGLAGQVQFRSRNKISC